MTATKTVSAPEKARTGGGPRIIHVPGSEAGKALCGRRINTKPAAPGGDRCVVCLEMAQHGRHASR